MLVLLPAVHVHCAGPYQITNAANGKCLNAWGGQAKAGAKLKVYDCFATANEDFLRQGNALTSLDGSLCVDVDGGDAK
eukprot:gene4283-4570_t